LSHRGPSDRDLRTGPGWQWLFLIEGIPAVVLAFVVFFYLTDHPQSAGWLASDEREWLSQRLLIERRSREAVRVYTVSEVLFDRRVIGMS
jgi:sugar phosphate permease